MQVSTQSTTTPFDLSSCSFEVLNHIVCRVDIYIFWWHIMSTKLRGIITKYHINCSTQADNISTHTASCTWHTSCCGIMKMVFEGYTLPSWWYYFRRPQWWPHLISNISSALSSLHNASCSVSLTSSFITHSVKTESQ